MWKCSKYSTKNISVMKGISCIVFRLFTPLTKWRSYKILFFTLSARTGHQTLGCGSVEIVIMLACLNFMRVVWA